MGMSGPTFPELAAENQRALVRFLTVDLETAFTFLDVAATTESEAHAQQAISNADLALQAVLKFAERVQERALRSRLLTRADQLRSAIKHHRR